MKYIDNVKNTALFIASARVALKDSIMENKMIEENKKQPIVNFILEDADSAEIISLLFEGKDHKISRCFAVDAKDSDSKYIAESFIGAGLSKLIGSNYSFIAENFGNEIAHELLNLTSDYDYNKITKLSEIKSIQDMTYEKVLNESIEMTKNEDIFTETDINYHAIPQAKTTGKDIANLFKTAGDYYGINDTANHMISAIKDYTTSTAADIKTIAHSDIPDMIKKSSLELYNSVSHGITATKKELSDALSKFDQAAKEQAHYEEMVRRGQELKPGEIQKMVAANQKAAYIETTIKELEGRLDTFTSVIKSFFSSVWDMIKHPQTIGKDVVNVYHDFIKDMQWIMNNKGEALDILKNKEYLKDGEMILGAAAIAAIAIYASTKIYSRNFSKYAKACSGKSGEEKTKCILQAKKNAYETQIKELEKTKGACSKAKDSNKCAKKIDKQIASLKKSASKL